MSTPEFSEEELRQIEAEMDRITVDDVLLQTVVTLLNLAARKAGLSAPEGEQPKRDLDQLREAIEGARALMPLLEQRHAEQLGPVRDTLARLQMVYAQLSQGGGAPGPGPGAEAGPGGQAAPGGGDPAAPDPGGPGPAQQSGRLWIPGQ
jgi:hypothetical protein